MTNLSILGIVIVGWLLPSVVLGDTTQQQQTRHYLLKTNALNYFQNSEEDTEVKGICVDGPPNGGDVTAPDAQTTNREGVQPDLECSSLGPCHVGFTQVRTAFCSHIYF
jgi:hypothetical protein